MKKTLTILTLAIIIALTSVNLNAQKVSTGNYGQTIYVNPFALIVGMIDVGYEQKLSPENSFTVNANYWSYYDWRAIGLGASYRWYFNEWANSTFNLNKKSLEGLSVGPRVEFYSWSWGGSSTFNNYDSYTSFGIGAEAGYKWVFAGGWTIEPGVKFVFPIGGKDYNSYNSYGGNLGLGYSW
jgi:hypothetical protein